MGTPDIWEQARTLTFSNEAAVETTLLLPLFLALGFDLDDIQPKVPVVAYPPAGKSGRKPEADFVVYSGSPHDRTTSLITVEAKHPNRGLESAKTQAEYYATWLRTPLYLLTNGKVLEVWQIQAVRECDKIIHCSVNELAEKRGQLESLLCKTSLISLCQTLGIKSIEVAEVDLTSYLDSLTPLFAQTDQTIRRFAVPNEGNYLTETEILTQVGSCTVVGESGSGKTELLQRLVGRAVSRLACGKDARVPFHVYLPDVVAVGNELETFLRNEVAAHQERMRTEAAFRDLLRAGIIVLADAFDRVHAGPNKDNLEAQLRSFIRAYPKTQILVATRPGVEPYLFRARLRLLPLETRDLIRIVADQHGLGVEAARNFYWSLPHYLRALAHNPFFLEHLVRAYNNGQDQVPRNLDLLFEGWLASVLDKIPEEMVSRFRMLDVLSALAEATVQGPLSSFDTDALFDVHCLGRRHLDILSGTGIVIRGPSGLELTHEIVADYLRARQLPTTFKDVRQRARLLELGAGKGSSLLAFAMARAQSNEDCRRLWSTVAALNVRTYLDALRSIPRSAMPMGQAQREWIVEEILGGYEELAIHQFATLKDSLRGFRDADDTSLGLCIKAYIAEDLSHLRYSYLPREQGQPRIQLVEHETVREYRFQHNKRLPHPDLPPEAARSLGVDDLFEELKSIIKARSFHGGLRWTREHLTARLTQFERNHKMRSILRIPVEDRLSALFALGGSFYNSDLLGMNVTDLHDHFIAMVATEVRTGDEYSNETVLIDEILGDLDFLTKAGASDEHPIDWALPSGDLPPPDNVEFYYDFQLYSNARILHFIHTLESRVDEAYREVAKYSFADLRPQLSHAASMPTNRQIFVTRLDSHGPARIQRRWRPVEHWSQHRVEIAMEPIPEFDEDKEYDTLSSELHRLGRPHRLVTVSGWSTVRIHTHSESDTIVMERVAEQILKDLKTVFQRHN